MEEKWERCVYVIRGQYVEDRPVEEEKSTRKSIDPKDQALALYPPCCQILIKVLSSVSVAKIEWF